MLGLLIFKIFYDDNICSGYISERFKFGSQKNFPGYE